MHVALPTVGSASGETESRWAVSDVPLGRDSIGLTDPG